MARCDGGSQKSLPGPGFLGPLVVSRQGNARGAKPYNDDSRMAREAGEAR